MVPIFTGSVKKGKLSLDHPDRFVVYLSGFEGKPVEVIVRKKKSVRSLQQDRAYFGIAIKQLCQKTGYTKEEMHEAMKVKFASRIDHNTGLIVVESTAKMSTTRFNEFYADIQKWAAEFLNLYIPDPGEIPLDMIT